MNLSKGYVAFVLHAHLPYVHHPDSEDYIEERWLFEAITETYIPLLNSFEKLHNEGINFKITMSLTPPLISMLTNKLIQNRYIAYLENLIELCEKECERTRDNQSLNDLSKMYKSKFESDLKVFKVKFKKNLINGFKFFQDLGYLEIITCAATHGFLPLMQINETAIRAQIAVGVETYKRHLGKSPRGIWLPECGYIPQIDKYLKDFGIEYAILETHGLLYADPSPVYGTAAPVISPSGLVAFARDLESGRQVWSSIDGYPGDFNYREFYRDIGFELEHDYIKPYIGPNGLRIDTGVKYHRITGKNNNKELYNPDWAMQSAETHAQHFMESRINQISYLSNQMHIPPIITCPYDAELFGHWWYEGPYWIYILFKKMHHDQSDISLITPSEYLDMYHEFQVSQPAISSWGMNGYNEMWLNETNDWIYPQLHECADKMSEIANEYKNTEKRNLILALNQCARELLLAQSSDWAFIMKTGTMVEYAHARTKLHVDRFNELYKQIKVAKINMSYLKSIREQDELFPWLDYKIYCH